MVFAGLQERRQQRARIGAERLGVVPVSEDAADAELIDVLDAAALSCRGPAPGGREQARFPGFAQGGGDAARPGVRPAHSGHGIDVGRDAVEHGPDPAGGLAVRSARRLAVLGGPEGPAVCPLYERPKQAVVLEGPADPSGQRGDGRGVRGDPDQHADVPAVQSPAGPHRALGDMAGYRRRGVGKLLKQRGTVPRVPLAGQPLPCRPA
jgi:hypothetical protein